MIEVGAALEPLGITSPVPMSGFAARTAPSVGEHDVLGARALALDGFVLIAVDVCALEESTCREIAQGVLPEAPQQVIVAATHTHSGPCSTPTRLTRCSRGIEQQIITAAICAGRSARSSRRPCRMSYRVVHGVGVASNRRHVGLGVDPPVQSLQFTEDVAGDASGSDSDGDGRVVASLVTYPCHPVVLDGANRLLSSDYVNPLRARIEQDHPGSVAVFAIGCAGDLNTGHSAEDSYSLQGATTRTFDEAHRVGTRIAETVLAVEAVPLETTGSSLASVPITLQIDRLGAAQISADQDLWLRERAQAEPGRSALLSLWLNWARDLPRDTEWTGRVSVIRLGEATVVALPGEPFWAVAELIASQVDGPCLVLGYADDCPGYIPTAGEYRFGGYEVEDAHRYYDMPGPFAAGSAEILIEAAVKACRALE